MEKEIKELKKTIKFAKKEGEKMKCKHIWRIINELSMIGCGYGGFDYNNPHAYSPEGGCVKCGNPSCGNRAYKAIFECIKCKVRTDTAK